MDIKDVNKNKSKNSKSAPIKLIIQTAPLIMIAVCIILYFAFFKGITVEQILAFTPDNFFIAALIICGLFALKSLSFFFPMLVIIVASGSIFHNVWIAILVNTIGVSVQILIPYLIGRYAERDLVMKIINKSKKADKLNEIKSKNEWFLSYFLRVINILPCDLVSLFFGSVGFKWKIYYIGSMLGILPGMIASTVVGTTISDPTSPKFMIALAVDFFFAAASAMVYRGYLKKQKHPDEISQ